MSKTNWPLSIMDSDKHAQTASNKGSNTRQHTKACSTSVATSTKPNANHRAKQQILNSKQEAAAAELTRAVSSFTKGKDAENKGSKKRKSRHPIEDGEETANNQDLNRPQQQQQQDRPKLQQQQDKKATQEEKRIPNAGTSNHPIALLDDSSGDDNDAEDNRQAKRSKPSAAAAAAIGTAKKQNGDWLLLHQASTQWMPKPANSRKNGHPKNPSNPLPAAASVGGEDKKKKLDKKLEKAANKAIRKQKKEEQMKKDMDLYTVVVPVTEEGLLIKIANVKIGVIFTGYRRFQNGDVGPVEANRLFQERGDLIVSVDGTWIVDKTWQETQLLLTQHNGRRERTFVVKKGAGKDYFEDTSTRS